MNFFTDPFYNAAPPLIYLNIDVMDTYSHIVFENSAHVNIVMHFRMLCYDFSRPLKRFCNA